MAIDSKHPDYEARISDWCEMRDSYAGERAVKAKETEYLPATAGMVLDGMGSTGNGYAAYCRYLARALFPGYVEEAVKDLIGSMHAKPPMIELPAAMEPLRQRATLNGESLELLLRRINEAQLLVGRIGLMLDIATDDKLSLTLPYVATYDAETVINWDDGSRDMPALQTLNLVVLDESEYERDEDLEWEWIEKYRVLILGDLTANESDGVYRQAEFKIEFTTDERGNRKRIEPVIANGEFIEPKVRGNPLMEIPFVFVGDTDLLPCPKKPPLLALADMCLAIYRNSADHEQGLHMQSQDTLVVEGGEDGKQYRTGAGATINGIAGGQYGAKFIGVDSSGLPEQRQNLENKHMRAREMAGQLIDSTSRAKESGEALNVRVAAQTVTLHQIAQTGAEGLQQILRIAARWIGANPEEVIVTPNTEFAESRMTPAEFFQLMQAKEKGLPLADEDIHELLVKNKLTAKEWKEVIDSLAEERGRMFDLPQDSFQRKAAA